MKTRLCPPCTLDEAADIAMASLADTIDAVVGADVGRRAIALDGEPGAWIPRGFEVFAQRGDGLDERLAAAVAEIGGPVVVIGMDTPQVTAELIDEVTAALCEPSVDAVMGFAEDGGYWVIGFRRSHPGALVGVPMSTDRTGVDQLDRLRVMGLRTAMVPTLCDVDNFDEALRVAELVPGSRFARAVAEVSAVAPVGRRKPNG